MFRKYDIVYVPGVLSILEQYANCHFFLLVTGY
jgi:hypothetical protein